MKLWKTETTQIAQTGFSTKTEVYRGRIICLLEVESHQCEVEYINADDVTAFCLNLMNKLRRNLVISHLLCFLHKKLTQP